MLSRSVRHMLAQGPHKRRRMGQANPYFRYPLGITGSRADFVFVEFADCTVFALDQKINRQPSSHHLEIGPGGHDVWAVADDIMEVICKFRVKGDVDGEELCK